MNATETETRWNDFQNALASVNAMLQPYPGYSQYGLDFDKNYEISRCELLSNGKAVLHIYDQIEQLKAAELFLSAEIASMNAEDICEINVSPHVLNLHIVTEERDPRVVLSDRFMVLINTEPLCFR
jgi:hypothetical protein